MTDRYGPWIRGQIEEHSPESGGSPYLAEKLAEAAAALAGQGTLLFGMVPPAELPDREALLQTALDALNRWLPELEAPQLAFVGALAQRTKLPIDVTPYASQIEAAQKSTRAKRRTASANSEPRNPELEAAIVANPDDRDAYGVLADWLQSQGAPRGELIALQMRAERDAGAKAAADKHLDDHADVLIGPLIDHVKMHDDSDRDAFDWRRGYISTARLSYDEHNSDLAVPLSEVLELVLQHPSGRLVHELVIGIDGEPSENDLQDLIDTIAEEQPIALRSLFLGDFEYPDQTEMSWFNVGDLSNLYAGVPQLQKLIVQGGTFTLGTIVLPELVHAEFRTGGLARENAQSIATATWPKLRHLDVWYGDDGYGGTSRVEDAIALLERSDMPALTHLGIMNAAWTDTVCEHLASSPLAKQLEELDLSMGTLGDDGANALLAALPKLPKLTKLDISNSYVSDPVVAALAAKIATVVADRQDPGSDLRYPTVGE